MEFPADLVEFLRRHDGVSPGKDLFKFPGGDLPLTIDRILQRGRMHQQLWNRNSEDLPDETYWHPKFLMFADCISPDGLVLDCRAGATFGAVGLHLKGSGTSFGHWSSLAAFLDELADCLEQGLAMGWWRKFVPIVWQEALTWEEAPTPLPVPRSLLELAATVPTPAASAADYGPSPAVAEEGWAGEYSSFCLTFVRGVDESELLRRFGALTDTRRPRSRGQAHEDAQRWTTGFRPVVRVGGCGQWAFGIEERHWEGSRSEVLRRLSHGTQAVSLHFSGFTKMSLYDDGELVTVYDTRRAYQLPGERDPFEILPELPAHGATAGRRLPDGRTVSKLELPTERTPMLQRMTLQTVCQVVSDNFGIDLPPSTLAGELASAHVLPVLPGVDKRHRPPSELAEHITAAPEARLRTVLAIQMASLAGETGLDTYPEVIEALARTGQESAMVSMTTRRSANVCAQSSRMLRQLGTSPGTRTADSCSTTARMKRGSTVLTRRARWSTYSLCRPKRSSAASSTSAGTPTGGRNSCTNSARLNRPSSAHATSCFDNDRTLEGQVVSLRRAGATTGTA